jgi:hypothetical protein
MIHRPFHTPDGRPSSHLLASETSREAAVVDPTECDLPNYVDFLDTHGLRLIYTLETRSDALRSKAAAELQRRLGSRRVAPRATREPGADRLVQPGDCVELAELRVAVLASTPPAGPDVIYAAGGMRFVGDAAYPDCGADPATELARRIDADLRESLERGLFSRREQRVARAYLRLRSESGGAPPSPRELADQIPSLDRGAVHVVVHSMRHKQIRLGRLPLELRGQTSKWLKGWQRIPSFTSHERELLAAYLQLSLSLGRPPSGPEIANALGGRRSLGWVRKRVHTVRRKQADFGQPRLEITRERPGS